MSPKLGSGGRSIYDARRLARVGQLAISEELEPYPRDLWTQDDWATPWEFVRTLEREFGPFELDPAASTISAKAPRFFTKAEDGLQQPWAPARVFLNPPYSHISQWLEKAIVETQRGATVVALLPVRSEMGWFHDLVLGRAEIRFLRGRQRFIGKDGTTVGRPVIASMLAVYR